MSREVSFQARVKKHMGKYKESNLGIKEDGIYYGNKKEYNHILPAEKSLLNIIEDYREDFYNSCYSKNLQYHPCFNHLNSSQAMCINFFYPLIRENKIQLILDILGIDDGQNNTIEEVCFEKESQLEEGMSRKTNFDFYINLKSGIEIFFEIKYTESSFGKAVRDDRHKENYNKVYKRILDKNNAIKQEHSNEEFFLNNYQIMRNIIHISDSAYVVFVCPKENRKIYHEALEVGNAVIREEYLNHFILYAWEEMIEELLKRLNSNKLIDYYSNEFSYKYLEY
ncbi:MAG: hypothetical protein GX080_01255 [Tissierellia bacterium]|nr:hypothetical protein [Tissierellia bacterium]